MTKKIQSPQGMLDILPTDIPLWHSFEEEWRKLVAAYGYEEIRFPFMEETRLFKRTIGEVTDIVEKEMFTFQAEEGKESLSLRPEGTAGCVRALIEHDYLRHHAGQRFWYLGAMFRRERPQKGRYRQFTHTGIEAFGMSGPDIEIEHILMTMRFWKTLGLENHLSLQINSLGSVEARQQYRQVLVDYLLQHEKDLDTDSQRRLKTNPLRILDSKNPAMANIIKNAPKCFDHLDAESKLHFEHFQQGLKDNHIPFVVNPNLVRGLDYYNRTVYEWVTDQLGAQGTVCAGGRYDDLVSQLGGTPVPGVGFAIGIERALLLQQTLGHQKDFKIDAYLIHVGENSAIAALTLAEKLRDQCPNLKLLVHCGSGNFKKQFEKADKSGAKLAFILGETELKEKTLGVKFLREEKAQLSLKEVDVAQFLTEYLQF